MKRAVKLAGGLLLLLIVAIAALFGAAQTGAGKQWTASEIGRLASDESTIVTITGLSGMVPFDLHVKRISVADGDGVYATIDDVALDIAAGALLARRLTIRELAARRIEVARAPHARSDGRSTTSLDDLLVPPLAVRLDRLVVGQIALAAPILGIPATLTVTGAGSLGRGRATAELAITRQDAPGRLDLHLGYGGAPAALHLDGTVSEPGGELLSSLFHYPQKLPLHVEVAGDGPLADWHGHVAATVGPASLDAAFAIKDVEDRHVVLEGGANLRPLLPEGLRAVIGEHATLSARTVVSATGDVTVEQLIVSGAAATLTASGRYGARDQALDGALTFRADDLAPFSTLAEQSLSGAGRVTMSISGTTTKPTGRVELNLSHAHFGADAVDDASLALTVEASGDPRDVKTPFAVKAQGKAAGIVADGKTLPGGLGDAVAWELAARFDRATGRLDLDQLAIDDDDARLEVTGGGDVGDPATASFATETRLSVPDLGRLGLPLRRGGLQLTAETHATANGQATVVVAATLDKPDFGRPPLDGALGAKALLRGTIERAPDDTITARDVEIVGENVRLSGDGRRSADGRISADYRLEAPRLQALQPDVTGQVTASGHVEGPADALAVTMALDGTARHGAHHLDRLAAKLAVEDISKPGGRLSAAFEADGIAGTVSAEAQLQGEILRIAKASIKAAGAAIDGAATINLISSRIDGTVAATIPDLKPFSEAAGTPISGAVEIGAKLTGGKTQGATTTLTASRLEAGSLKVGNLRLQSAMADLQGKPTGRAELTIAGLAAGAVAIDAAHVTSGAMQPGRFLVNGDLKGTAGAPIALTLAAVAGIDKGAFDVTLSKLSGQAAGTPLSLGGPLRVTWRGGSDVTATGLALALGQGRLTGDLALIGVKPSAHLVAKSLPIATFAHFAGREGIDGALGFEMTLGGTRAAPDLHLVVDAEQVHLALASRPDLPPLGAVAAVDLHGGEMRLRGRLAGPKNAAIGFSGSVPAALSLEPPSARLPPDGALALHVDGDGDLANLIDLLPLGEDRISGRFAIDIDVGGTVAAPTASGSVTVDKAQYVSLTTGTELSGISLKMTGDRQRLVLHDFTAGDGAKGTMTIGGAVDLAASPGPALDVSAELKSFRALRRDDVTATVSGTVHVGGTATAPDAKVALAIDQADINIPDKLPQSAQPIQVTIIDSKTGRTLSKRTTAATGGGLAAALDVTVDMPGRIFVRGRGLDSEWRGKIAVAGTSAAPDITGSLEVVHGTFSFAGQTLNVDKGTIRFPGGSQIDPLLDVQASAQSNDIVAIVTVTGTAKAPKIALSSEPALPQDEILSRLLFGSSMSQISPAQGLQLAQAAASLAGSGDLSVLDKLRQGFGLDRLSLGSTQNSAGAPGLGVPAFGGQPGVAAPATGLGTTALAPGQTTGAGTTGSGLSGTGVSAGKYVANGVYVGVTQGLGSGGSSVNVQVDVSKHISVDTQAGTQDAGSGVGVDWKLDY